MPTTVAGTTYSVPATTVAGATYAAPATTVAGATYARPATTVAGTTYARPATTSVVAPTAFSSVRSVGSPTVLSSPTTVVGGFPSTTYAGARPAKIISGGIVTGGYAAAPVVYGGFPAVQTVQGGGMFNASAAKAAYEVKKHDPQLSTLKQVKAASGLKHVNVMVAATAFRDAAMQCGGRLNRDQFMEVKANILQSQNVQLPPQNVSNAVFDLFDKDDNDSVDMMELICGVSLLCKGNEEEKVQAVFMMFDTNGDGFVTENEMYQFLLVVFKVVCTPSVMDVVNSAGVPVSDIDDMARATTMECFQTADLNHDGKLSLDEFKKWFNAPRNDPAMIFAPVQSMIG